MNVTEHDMRRVEIPFSVAYDSDMEKVKRVTLETIKDVDGFLKDEQVIFYIDEFADSGINIYVKFYATIEKFLMPNGMPCGNSRKHLMRMALRFHLIRWMFI